MKTCLARYQFFSNHLQMVDVLLNEDRHPYKDDEVKFVKECIVPTDPSDALIQRKYPNGRECANARVCD